MARGIKDDDLATLYGAPLEEFVAERDALAKRLRSDGNGDLADEVHGLKKPSAAAWAVNQAVRAKPEAAKRLVEAGQRLAAAQSQALEGGREGVGELRDAMGEHNAAVEEMTAAVREAGGEEGVSEAMLDRAAATLRAVAADEELRAEFEGGRITQDRTPSGFGGPLLSQPAKGGGKEPKTGARKRRRREQRAEAAERKLADAEEKVAEARGKVERAQEDLESARAALERAESERSERESELEAARAPLAEHEG